MVIRVCSCIAFGMALGVALLVVGAAVASQYADLGLFQEKHLDPRLRRPQCL